MKDLESYCGGARFALSGKGNLDSVAKIRLSKKTGVALYHSEHLQRPGQCEGIGDQAGSQRHLKWCHMSVFGPPNHWPE